jgi:hypothetical protein
MPCTIFHQENLKGRNYLRNLDVSGIIILKWILRKYGVGCIHVEQNRIRRALVNTEMSLRVFVKGGKFLDKPSEYQRLGKDSLHKVNYAKKAQQ